MIAEERRSAGLMAYLFGICVHLRPSAASFLSSRCLRGKFSADQVSRDRKKPQLFLFCRSGRWREEPVQAQIHRCCAVMICPTAGEAQRRPGPRTWLIVKPGDVVVQL